MLAKWSTVSLIVPFWGVEFACFLIFVILFFILLVPDSSFIFCFFPFLYHQNCRGPFLLSRKLNSQEGVPFLHFKRSPFFWFPSCQYQILYWCQIFTYIMWNPLSADNLIWIPTLIVSWLTNPPIFYAISM